LPGAALGHRFERLAKGVRTKANASLIARAEVLDEHRRRVAEPKLSDATLEALLIV